jgi:hypothetical protein
MKVKVQDLPGCCAMVDPEEECAVCLVCRGCASWTCCFADEPCKSCTVRPSNFEEKNENQSDEIS